MEEFLRAALGMHSCDVCGPLESKRTGRQSPIANLDNPKMASGVPQTVSVAVVYRFNLPSACALHSCTRDATETLRFKICDFTRNLTFGVPIALSYLKTLCESLDDWWVYSFAEPFCSTMFPCSKLSCVSFTPPPPLLN